MRYALLGASVTALLAYGGAANATPTQFEFSYAISETYSPGQGGFTPIVNGASERIDIGPLTNQLVTALAYNTPLNLTLNTPTANQTFFMLNPAATCTGNGCVGNSQHGTETDTFTVTFTFSEPGAATSSQMANGTFQADYQTQFDTVTWQTPNPLTFKFADGATLLVTLVNGQDWDIKSQISFDMTTAPDPVPEPASLGLLGLGMLGTLAVARRRRA